MKTIKICHGHACKSNMSPYVFERAASDLGIKDPEGGMSKDGKVKLEKCPCRGNCKKGPSVVIENDGREQLHSYTNPVEMGKLLKKTGGKKKFFKKKK